MKTIGIIGAMDLEIRTLIEKTKVISVKNIVGANFILGSLEGNNAVLVKCGIGKVNAAVCTQIMIDMYGVDCIINIGVAGALAEGLNVGDVVISSDAMHHDINVEALGYAPGVIPDMETSLFEADSRLIETAKEALAECGIKGMVGRVAGGDIFVADSRLKEYIVNNFNAACCEMEGSAIAQTCYLNKIPFVIIRAMSDSADNSGNMDYPAFKALAAAQSEKIVSLMLAKIS